MKKIIFLSFMFTTTLFLTGCAHVFQADKDTTSRNADSVSPSGEIARFDIDDPEVSRFVATSPTTTQPAVPEQIEEQTEQTEPAAITQAAVTTNYGQFTVEFFRDDAPQTVENFIRLAKNGFYNGIKFHRVIKDFMVQAGDPLTKDDSKQQLWGTGGPGYMFDDEINNHVLVQGSLAMANAGPNTNGSQFFIVTAQATPWLDGKHTNFGKVIEGMEVVMRINEVATEGPYRPVEPVVIERIELK